MRSGRSHKQSRPGELLVRLEKAGVRKAGMSGGPEGWRVRDVSLELRRGQIVTLVGPNGSGKSTTAKMILGLAGPDSGVLWRKPGIRIGYAPQKLRIDPSLPLSAGRFLSLLRPVAGDEMKRALERTGAGACLDRQLASLSGGEFQRVLLARAILGRPDLLVLDEPVQGVDIGGEAMLYRLIAQLPKELDCAILLISHDLHMVMSATDLVICLNNHMCCSGTPEKIGGDPAFARLFGGDERLWLAPYRHLHDHHHCADGSIAEENEGG